jgi:uncharacterized ferredoxin-like protein
MEQDNRTYEIIQNAVKAAAEMMAVAAITAPKAKGENYVAVKILQGDEVQQLAAAMQAYGEKSGKTRMFTRDGKNVSGSDAVVLIGLIDSATAGLDCGACGYETCAELLSAIKTNGEFSGPICAYRVLDLGIALGSAVKTASLYNLDNRIMYSVGVAARDMKLVDWEFAIGIPLSVSGKSIYFDRK